MIRVVSLMWGDFYERCGHRFLKTFEEFWPASVELVVVTDKPLPTTLAQQINLEDVSGYRSFMNRWAADPRARGLRPPQGVKVDRAGRSWRHDAVTWMPQALAPVAALTGMQDGDIFVWLDGDVRTTQSVPEGWLGDLLSGADVACLQRQPFHSEIGFYAMRLGEQTRLVLDLFARAYTEAIVFDLKEQHSAFVFDWALAHASRLKVRNLCHGAVGNHVFPQSPLYPTLLHDKGKRKDQV